MLKTISNLLLLIVALCYCPVLAFGQTEIAIPDTLIPRGEVYNINVKSLISPSNASNIKIIFTFDARVINIKSVTGGNGFVLQCNPTDVQFNYDRPDLSTLEINCNNLITSNQKLCSFDIEGLVGPDSISYITVSEIAIDGVSQTTSNLHKSTIVVPGYPVIQQYVERLGQNYPNPFGGKTYFPFVIDNPTKIKFYIYSGEGQLVSSSEDDGSDLSAMLITKNGLNKKNIKNESFDKGNYLLEFAPSLNLTQGIYFMVLATDNGRYNRSFVYIK